MENIFMLVFFPVAVQFFGCVCENYIFLIENNFLPSFAITPGRKVHFAAVEESPIEFKSSVIRFCIYESKAFKKRLVVTESFCFSEPFGIQVFFLKKKIIRKPFFLPEPQFS